MKYIQKLIKGVSKYFKPVKFETLVLEDLATKNVPSERREEAIIDLRFKAWSKYHCLDMNVFERRKMRLAFHAGARSIMNVNNK